ncbi:MAG: hypothetical protein QT00_C0002G0012 [archaeon GW2011_AR5]|nr:MAG: hypothetical protein QT00_C0002G0012 [archaeon GW2011_AR5]
MEPSSKSSGAVRTFTIEEANELLPFITESLNKAFVLNERIKSLTNDIENLVSIWGKDVLERGHIDNAYYFSKVTERESVYQGMINLVNGIQANGCIVKDIETGLVDFYFSNNGELAFLCWKYGEQRIKHWHPVDEGFKTRRPIRNF